MFRYKAIIEYEGTLYHGMQKQKGDIKTIQSVLETAISKFANTDTEIDFSGRTDTGVHALGQVIHFDLHEERKIDNIIRGINFYLVGEKIVVKNVEKVDKDFHSRFSAKSRVYLYRVLNSLVYSPLLEGRVFFYHYNLDIDKMRKVARKFVGKKMDFSAFCNVESLSFVNPMRTIDKIEIIKVENEIHFIFEAKSFLHNMIRIMTGVLLEVGRGKIDADDVDDILEKKTRCQCETLPACGLYLLKVNY